MKQLLYPFVFCCMALLGLTACEDDSVVDLVEPNVVSNSIVLDFDSSSLPVSRATPEAAGVEVKVEHLDVIIFASGDDTKKVVHERVSNLPEKQGKVVLAAKRSSFMENAMYNVYVIANSTEPVATFQANDFNLGTLKGLMQTDRAIHLTGLQTTTGATIPTSFLMDGMAYTGDTESNTAVVLYDGNKSENTELKVTLRRAAAKIVVNIKKGEKVTFDTAPTTHNAGYYLRNMPYSTSVISGVDGEADRRTPDPNTSKYFNWTADMVTVTAYAYAADWSEASSLLENEVRLIVNIPLTYNDTEGSGGVFHESSYYQIPVSQSKMLKRNTCYEVNVTLNAPGGSNPANPLELEPMAYSVAPWTEKEISVGGESDRPAYLTLNEYDMEMHNMAEDSTTLAFASSSEVTAKIDSVYYIDKFGKKKELAKTGNSQYPNEWGEKIGSYRPSWKNKCTITITPDENITGKIDVFGTVPENNAVRYIVFTVTNEEGIKREVKVAQYPLTYITNVEGYYSYRNDFVSTAPDNTSGLTTWLLLAGMNKYDIVDREYDWGNRFTDWRTSCSWSGNHWTYGQGTSDFFVSKVAQNINSSTGLCQICYYQWNEQWNYNILNPKYSYSTSTSSVDNLQNHRMYHVTITATSSEYTLGRPRITSGKTDPNADNAVLVSPSFMLASQLGAVLAADNVNIAASHCEQYVEVAQDGTVYDDWRLPTRAEIEIIYKYQNESDVMDEVLSGDRYWSASGRVTKPGITSTDDEAIRCIRDAYDKKTGK